MGLEELINDLKKSIEHFTELMKDPNEIERYKDANRYAVSMLGYLEELKELRIINKNISRELITRTDNLKKVNKEAQKYFDLLMDDERVINEMAIELRNRDFDFDYDIADEDLYDGIIDYFRKKCE